MKILRPALLTSCLLCTLFLLASPGLAQGQSDGVLFRGIFDGGGVFGHPCRTELLQCSGRSGVIIHSIEDHNGVAHFTSHFQDMDLVCIGLSTGVTYKSVFTETVHRNNIVGGFDACVISGCTSSLSISWHMISRGSSPNLKSRTSAHITFNGQGEPIIVEFAETELSCD